MGRLEEKARAWHRAKYPGVYTGMTLSMDDYNARARMDFEIGVFTEGLRAGIEMASGECIEHHRSLKGTGSAKPSSLTTCQAIHARIRALLPTPKVGHATPEVGRPPEDQY